MLRLIIDPKDLIEMLGSVDFSMLNDGRLIREKYAFRDFFLAGFYKDIPVYFSGEGMPRTLYGFAAENRVCYGHGDFATVDQMSRMGPYGSGEFPPVFETREEAEAWRDAQEPYKRPKIVELRVGEHDKETSLRDANT